MNLDGGGGGGAGTSQSVRQRWGKPAAALAGVVRKDARLKLPSLTSGGVFDPKIFSYRGSCSVKECSTVPIGNPLKGAFPQTELVYYSLVLTVLGNFCV